VAEEIWAQLGHSMSLLESGWPEADPAWLKAEKVEIALQVNGKVRARLTVPAGLDEAGVRKEASSNPSFLEHMDPAKIVKVVWVQDRLANFVVKP
jgi:leucyl-tRNA synthetase